MPTENTQLPTSTSVYESNWSKFLAACRRVGIFTGLAVIIYDIAGHPIGYIGPFFGMNVSVLAYALTNIVTGLFVTVVGMTWEIVDLAKYIEVRNERDVLDRQQEDARKAYEDERRGIR